MPEPVIPDVSAEAVAPVSKERAAQLKRVELSHAAFSSLGAMPIKCLEAEKAAELMRFLDDNYTAECKALDRLIALEALGTPVEVNGSVLSLAKAH